MADPAHAAFEPGPGDGVVELADIGIAALRIARQDEGGVFWPFQPVSRPGSSTMR
jgi:hypothetical protein